jgi:YhcH/YjgK/YiaL family protein
MILDSIADYHRYLGVHPAFAQAFHFLVYTDLASMGPGRRPLEGDRMYVSIDHLEGRGRDGARLEAHRKYLDIQLTIDGGEEIGWAPLASCRQPAGRFDDAKDIGFFENRPDTWLSVPPGRFAIFFPTDAHAPLAGRGLLKKAIVKVAVSW